MDLPTLARGLGARSGLGPAPISVGFELTHRCNLSCSYCDRHSPSPGEMSRDQILRALSELHSLGMRHVSLDGGEPLTHRHVDEIAAFLVQRQVRVYMNTNGILVPRKLATVRLLSKVKISLDGPAACHDAVRGEGAWRRAVVGALAARDAGVPVELTCVVGRHNVDHVDELLAFADHARFPVGFQPGLRLVQVKPPHGGSHMTGTLPLHHHADGRPRTDVRVVDKILLIDFKPMGQRGDAVPLDYR